MPIPEFERVVYERPGLAQVLCQLRFPTILRITNEDPAAFQEGIRRTFPNFKTRQPSIEGLPDQIKNMVPDLGGDKSQRLFDFESEDGAWKTTLTNNFLALSTNAYTRWEQFQDNLRLPLERLHEIYEPAYYSRVGLRYRNVIVRSHIGLDDVPWSDLLQPHIAGELADEHIGNEIEHASREVAIQLPEYDSKVLVRHGFAHNEETQEVCYVIDADYFTEQRTERDHVFHRLGTFNRYAGRLFRWCISDRLYEALHPNPVD